MGVVCTTWTWNPANGSSGGAAASATSTTLSLVGLRVTAGTAVVGGCTSTSTVHSSCACPRLPSWSTATAVTV